MDNAGRDWLTPLAQTWHAYERDHQLATHRQLIAAHYRSDMLAMIGRRYRRPFLITAAGAAGMAAVLMIVAILGGAPWIWSLIIGLLIIAGTVSATGVYLSKRPQLLRNIRFRRTIHRLKHTAHFSRLAQTDWAIHNEQQHLFKQPLVMATLQALPANLRNQQAVAGLYVLLWRQQAPTLGQAIAMYQHDPRQVGMSRRDIRQLLYQTKAADESQTL